MPLSGIALVTGGAGFIGSHIASALVANGARVRVIDDLSTGYLENLKEIGGDIDFVQGSLADEEALNKALEDVELVFHEAALPSVPRSVENPRRTHVACVDSTFSLLVAAKERKVRSFFYEDYRSDFVYHY
jgi:UDP-glucose 4-epimerase